MNTNTTHYTVYYCLLDVVFVITDTVSHTSSPYCEQLTCSSMHHTLKLVQIQFLENMFLHKLLFL